MRRKSLLAAGIVLAMLPLGAAAQDAPGPLEALERATNGMLDYRIAPETGALSFIRATGDAPLDARGLGAPPERRARDFLARHGELFGAADLRLRRVEGDLAGGTHVRFDQLHHGLEVFGAQMVVHMDGRGITGVSGYLVPVADVDVRPTVAAAAAAAAAVAGYTGLKAADTKLGVFRTGLVEGEPGRTTLAWAVEVGGERREQVWVDAVLGNVLSRIPLEHEARYRVVHSPMFVPEAPELFVVREETTPLPRTLPPFDNLYDFTGNTYDLFWNAFGFDAWDGQGAKMRTVYLVNQVCPNAYWDGTTTNYCPGFDLDDVVGHEWAHAYTDSTHNLIYLCQPGALNESYSDIWGEVIDLLNGVDGVGGANNAQPWPDGQRWLVGEDLTERVHNLLLRDMWSPRRLGDPDRVGAGQYQCGTDDNGGVHSNSGVPNHAFSMLADGKTFRNVPVRGLGLTKAAHIYWQAMAHYQTPVSKFADHDLALNASCRDLLGVDLRDLSTGASSGQVVNEDDCAQVAAAMTAVQMSLEPVQCRFRPLLGKTPPAVCEGATPVFTEDFETGLDGWTIQSAGRNPLFWPGLNWETRGELPGARAGSAAFALDPQMGGCQPGRRDVSGRFSMDSPPITVPEGGLQLRFDHLVETQREYDGGNVSVSVNGGEFTLVPQDRYAYNAPNLELPRVTLAPAVNTNPKAGEYAWSGADGGEVTGSWGTTVADLSGLAAPGAQIRLRFEFGINCGGGLTGWFVDDVHVYSCPPAILP